MLTRRVRGRQFLLRPGRRTNEIIGYVLAIMQKKWKIRINAVVVMSNHWHIVLYDEHGNIVDFQRDCHSFIGRALNAAHGEFGALWSSTPTSRVVCEMPEDTVSKMAYTLANPTRAGLVAHGKNWPGIRAAWPAKAKTYKRPRIFFSEKTWADEATLDLYRPNGYEDIADDVLAAEIASKTHALEEETRQRFQRKRRRFIGRRAILRQARHARPRSRETRFGISPQVACRDKWRRIERLQLKKRWRVEYDEALGQTRAGVEDVVFPYGTYLMRVRFGVKCAGPPS